MLRSWSIKWSVLFRQWNMIANHSRTTHKIHGNSQSWCGLNRGNSLHNNLRSNLHKIVHLSDGKRNNEYNRKIVIFRVCCELLRSKRRRHHTPHEAAAVKIVLVVLIYPKRSPKGTESRNVAKASIWYTKVLILVICKQSPSCFGSITHYV